MLAASPRSASGGWGLFPYVAGQGTRLFDGVPASYQLDLVSSTASGSGIVELTYRRHR